FLEHGEAEAAVGYGHQQSDEGADAGGFGGGGPAGEDRAEHRRHQNYRWHQIDQRAADAFANWHGGGFFRAERGAPFRVAPAQPQHVQHVAQRQQQPWHDGGQEQLAHRQLRFIAHDDQHDAGRDQYAEGAAGGDHPGGDFLAVA